MKNTGKGIATIGAWGSIFVYPVWNIEKIAITFLGFHLTLLVIVTFIIWVMAND